jgi:hypothetical protein
MNRVKVMTAEGRENQGSKNGILDFNWVCDPILNY